MRTAAATAWVSFLPLQASSWYQYGSAYAEITSAIPFNTVVFQDISGPNSFEFGQLSVSSVPAPSTLSLMLGILLAMALLLRSRHAKLAGYIRSK